MFTFEKRHMVKTYFTTGATKTTIGCTSFASAMETASKEYLDSTKGVISPVEKIEIYNKKGLVKEIVLG